MPPVEYAVAFLKDPEGRVDANLKAYLPKTSVHIFPPFPPEGEKRHVALYMAQCLQRSGLPIDAEESMEEARRRPMFMNRVQRDKRENIVFHPGSGGHKKNHPPDFWVELIKRMKKRPLFKQSNFLLLLGPAEESFGAFFKENLERVNTEILISPDRKTLISLLKGALHYIGHDSGITHLASMHGVPTIALFKSSSIHQWKPIGPAVKVIEGKGDQKDLIWEILTKADELMKETVTTQEPGVRIQEPE